jgi:hypothetical protein
MYCTVLHTGWFREREREDNRIAGLAGNEYPVALQHITTPSHIKTLKNETNRQYDKK